MRILSATMAAAALLLAIKLVDVTEGTESLIESVQAQSGEAPKSPVSATPPEGATPPADKKKEDAPKPDEAKKAEADKAKPDDKSAKPEEKKDAKPEAKAEGKEGEAKKSEGEPKKEGKEGAKENPAVSEQPGDTTDHRFTNVELELLQNLAKRREELNQWENNIQIKEAALDATQKRIDAKIQQVEAMKQEVSNLLAQYNAQEDAKIQSLVKIYENMKPQDAARIFDEVEMPILLLVIDKMPEKKSAPILAAMDSKKAKQLTVELAEQRKLSMSKINSAAAPLTPAAPQNAIAPPKTP